jgi:hypothetical protein
MKNTFLKTIGTMLAILMLAMFAQISASAQDKNNKEESNVRTEENLSAQRENNDRKLEGSWNIQVTRRNCQTGEALVTFPTMTTFMSGGTMQDYGVALAPTGRGSRSRSLESSIRAKLLRRLSILSFRRRRHLYRKANNTAAD